MTTPVPDIDPRTSRDIAKKVQDLIKVYAPAWQECDPVTGQATGVSGALIGIFARFCELIIQRLNQAPQKNFLAFLDMLGASLLPLQPARVPLTFSLAAGSATDGLVPAGTRVAAPPDEGEKEPVIFETERELTVTAAQLTSLFVRDPARDQYADDTTILAPPLVSEALIFRGDRRIEHIFYIGQSQLLGFPAIESLRLTFTLVSPPRDARVLHWEIWDGSQWQDKTPSAVGDETNSLQQSGTIEFGALSAVPSSPVSTIDNRWIRCRMLTPITSSTEQRGGMERASQLPLIRTIQMAVSLKRKGLAGDAAFTNQLPVDVSKDFFPFGEKPKFADTFWLAQREAFLTAGARITLSIDLRNPAGSNSTLPPPTTTAGKPILKWEVWNGVVWSEMGTATTSGPQSPIANEFKDTTNALTISGQVSFRLPEQVAVSSVNGVENCWLRVRIISGDYGQEARYEPKEPNRPDAGYNFFPATFAPPVINSIRVDYDLSKAALPEVVLTFNDFIYQDVTLISNDPRQSFAPFRSTQDVKPTLYVGFTLPTDRLTFPNRTLSLYARLADLKYGERPVPISPETSKQLGVPASVVSHKFIVTNAQALPARFTCSIFGTRWQPAPVAPPAIDLLAGASQEVAVQVTIPPGTPEGDSDHGFLRLESTAKPDFEYTADFVTFAGAEAAAGERLQLVWEYWNGQRWSAVTVRDDTENFTRPALIEFLAPPDIAQHQEFGQTPRYWLRVRWESGEYALAPRLRRLLLNTTMAAQAVTLNNEILGSSDGSSEQKFRATRKPILAAQQPIRLGPRLEVREPERPSAAEQATLAKEEGADAVPPLLDATGRPREIWVRWREVTDFYGSGPRDRHYVLDHVTGEIRFGDGLHGLIPPVGIGNIRLAHYQIGGGKAGNKPASTIVQLKTTVPYVDKVTNTEAASGGADAETSDSLLFRAPRTIRHGNRAVTVEDYEDLAMLASPEVARAKCVPLRNLLTDPLGQQKVRGEISVIIVPRSSEAKPQPTLELLSRVQDYLEVHSVPTVRVAMVGPLYLRVEVKASIALVSLEGASTVAQAIQQKLASFLHPLTGGLDGAGWDFGRKPHRSDVYALLEAVPGVDHLRSLEIVEQEDQPGVSATGRFLVFSGTHAISLVFAET